MCCKDTLEDFRVVIEITLFRVVDQL